MPTIGQARQAIADAQARAELYRMWQQGFHAGLTHPRVLDALGTRRDSVRTERFRQALLEGTSQRRDIASIIEQNGALVQPFESALLGFGEESGTLERSLAALATHFAAEQRLLRQVWSALTYPLVTSLVALFIAPLPILVAGNARAYLVTVALEFALWYAFGGAIVSALAARYANRSEFVLARFARALATGMEAGLPLDRVVTLAAEASGQPQLRARVRSRTVRQLATEPVSETFAGCSILPFEMMASLRVAEASGDFSSGLRKLAELYDGQR
ncbi:MAG TPA: type II secretion system F family protein [Longimicrobiales bacterium]|nr:type II secretion system F family protein [Longimicrobiales bacterium]